MTLFIFDNTFEGLLTSVFEAYSRRTFPDALLAEGEPLPLFCDEAFTVVSDEEKAGEGLAWFAEKTFCIRLVLSYAVLVGGRAGNCIAFVPLYPQGNRCFPFH